eukprot:TRINITY_DN69783_c0_g1_i1.p1 TRINITY_DN69783_c0_g1~~TRINITY_DN69783_c0_g1_i1.p1  ORF type:complete len:143 (+),score=45.35 TRINITY_DN69783_c0_g1_i1:171-599(+)
MRRPWTALLGDPSLQLAVEDPPPPQPPNPPAEALHVWAGDAGKLAIQAARSLAYARSQAEVSESMAREAQAVLKDITTLVGQDRPACVKPFLEQPGPAEKKFSVAVSCMPAAVLPPAGTAPTLTARSGAAGRQHAEDMAAFL